MSRVEYKNYTILQSRLQNILVSKMLEIQLQNIRI